MKKIVFLFALALALPVSANDASRCGVDAFGNTVCMDKDGVLTNSPKKTMKGKSGGEASGKGAPVGTGSKSGGNTDSDEAGPHVRCGTDQFGNKVCANN